MKRTLSLTCVRFFLLLVTAPAGAGFASPAWADVIRCPDEALRSEVVSLVPDGWRSKPVDSVLRETQVMTLSDGKLALNCLYSPAGTLQRDAPEGTDCVAVLGGFVCTETAAGSIVSTGVIELRQTYRVDFDSGRVGVVGADLWFQAEAGEELYLTPSGGAQLGLGNGANRGRDGCAEARLSKNRVSLRQINIGTYLCLRTGDGRIAQLRVDAISLDAARKLEISYTTWR